MAENEVRPEDFEVIFEHAYTVMPAIGESVRYKSVVLRHKSGRLITITLPEEEATDERIYEEAVKRLREGARPGPRRLAIRRG